MVIYEDIRNIARYIKNGSKHLKTIVEISEVPYSMSDLLIDVAQTWIKENLGAEAYREMTNEEFEMIEDLVMEGLIGYKIVKGA